MDYEIKRGDIGKLGGEAQVRSMVAGKLDVLEKKINDSYTLKAKFLSPVNVCIKPIELVIKSSSATGPQILGTADVKGSISITAVQ